MPTKILPNEHGRQMISRLKRTMSKKRISKLDRSALKTEILEAFATHKPKVMPDKFQHPRADNIVIYNDDNTEVYRKTGKIPKKVLDKLASRYPKATVLTSLGNDLYKALPIKLYKKLIKIKFVLFERSFEFLTNEFPDELYMFETWFEFESMFEYIYSLNQLLMITTTEEVFDKANQIYLTAKFFRMSSIEKTCKILFKNGSVKEMSYAEFLNEYKLNMEFNFFGKQLKKE